MHKIALFVLVGFLFTAPTQQIASFPGASTLIRLSGLLVLTFALLSVPGRGKLNLRPPSLMLALAVVFALWAFASNLWALSSPSAAFTRAFTYAQLAALVWVIWQLCRTHREHLLLLQAYVIGSYFLGGKLVFDFLTNPRAPDPDDAYLRYSGIGASSSVNETASMCAVAIPIAWYLATQTKRPLLSWFNFVYLPTALLAIGLTASRAGLIAAAVGLLLVPLSYPSLSLRKKIIMPALLVAAGIIAYSQVPEQNLGRFQETSSELTQGNVSNRAQLWGAGLTVYGTVNPLLGIGVGNYASAIEPVLGYSKPAHSAFLAVLVELGLVGITLFVGIFFGVLPPLLKLRGPHRAFYLILWLTLLISMLTNNAEDDRYVWIILTLITTRATYVLSLTGAPKPSPAPGRVGAYSLSR